MSVSFSALLVYGMPVKNGYTVSRVKAFPHSYPDSMNFCPKTGKILWREDRIPVISYEDFEEVGLSFFNVKLVTGKQSRDPSGKKIMSSPKWVQSDPGTHYLIGVEVCHLDYGDIAEIPSDLSSFKMEAEEKIRKLFSSLNIEEEINLNLYVMNYSW